MLPSIRRVPSSVPLLSRERSDIGVACHSALLIAGATIFVKHKAAARLLMYEVRCAIWGVRAPRGAGRRWRRGERCCRLCWLFFVDAGELFEAQSVEVDEAGGVVLVVVFVRVVAFHGGNGVAVQRIRAAATGV